MFSANSLIYICLGGRPLFKISSSPPPLPLPPTLIPITLIHLYIFSKNRHPRKLRWTFFSPAKLALFSLLKELKTSPDGKVIKLPTFDNLFLPLRLSQNDDGHHIFLPKWCWFMLEHYLVLRKSRSCPHPRTLRTLSLFVALNLL